MAPSRALSGEDYTLFRWLAGGRLLVAIIFLGAHLKKVIEENFNRVSAMRMEPKLLCDQGDSEQSIFSSYVEERDDSTFKHRRKAFDLMSCLDELLSRVNISLSRKPNQTVREHLTSLQGPPYSPFEGNTNLCENVACLYEQARYGDKDFSEEDYLKYSSGIDQLYNTVHQKFLIPGSLVVNSGHHHLMKSSDDSAADSMAVDENSVVLPSTLMEDKTSLRYRSSDTSKLQVT